MDAANLEDVSSFFKTYYAPNNAALSIVGDFEMEETKAWIQKYFGDIPASDLPAKPDISEPKQTEEKTFVKDDALANKPAIALAYHMPQRNSPEYFAMGLLDQILVQGDNSLLAQKLEKEKGFTSNVSGGINYLGNMFNYQGPMLWMYDLTYDNDTSKEDILTAIDEVMNGLKDSIDQAMIDQAIIKIRSQLYDDIGGTFGLGRADLLCAFALFDNNPERINTLEDSFKEITPKVVKKTIDTYLIKTNRTVLTVNPLLAENDKTQS
ncbi:M16 family metallopeptidase [Maribacter sp. 4G9]|uniref:M16 family metallopeptidase n=1 Tax=Maribacter sp. 4G9 TaxID=1889777 RepID=UPI001F0A0DF6|nr:insulinase family protein [Maribacter sp. 4G9]